MSDRKFRCNKYLSCCNHDSWYCDECRENENIKSYFQSRYTKDCYNIKCQYFDFGKCSYSNDYNNCILNKDIESEDVNNG